MTRRIALAATTLLLAVAAGRGQSPLTYSQPAPPPPPPPGALVEPEPLFGPPAPAPVPGLFFGVEIALLKPTASFTLISQRPLGMLRETVAVSDVALPWTVSPTFEIGFGTPEGGAFVLAYQFLAAEGNGQAFYAGDAAASRVRTRLDVQVFDLDYAFAPFEVAPRWEMTARLGGRLANIFFDSRADSGAVLRQGSTDFFGAGIHGRLEVQRRIVVVPGLGVFGRADGAVLLGRPEQRFRLERDYGPVTEVSRLTQRDQMTVPVLNVQAGLTYSPPALPAVHFATGYEFEQYFDVGGVNPSSGDVRSHGWFLRGRIDF